MARKPPKAAPNSLPGRAPDIELSEGERHEIRESLLAWYRSGHREMPWRRSRDPYAIWVSEIMLQQTRVDTVREPFARFMARFPTVNALADAPLADVLAEWSGLGYYARARNLHAAAGVIRDQHGGHFPVAADAVRALPGVGPYTAGAIRSIAFGQRAPILDGNVTRVLSRLFAIDLGPERAEGKRLYWRLAEELLPASGTRTADAEQAGAPRNDVGDFNQALMELGAVVCTPGRPSCLMCPLSARCQARAQAAIERYPPPKLRSSVPIVQAVTVLISPAPRTDPDLAAMRRPVLLLRRPESGLWGGLWEPPTLWLDSDESGEASEGVDAGLLRLLQSRLGLRIAGTQSAQALRLPGFTHVLSHREIRFTPFALRADVPRLSQLQLDGYESARWVDAAAPQGLALSAWVSALLFRVTQGELPASM
jgi:A/G-specific adenine glycosylase